MSYNQIQFIGYEIYTGPQQDPSTGKKKYLGITNIDEDIKQRIALLKLALEKTHNASDRRDTVLKIFVVPEFYFRGPKGAYEMDKVQLIIYKLRQLIKDNKWEHWLFIFGTILGISYSDSSKEVYNFTLVQKGGFGEFFNVDKYLQNKDRNKYVISDLQKFLSDELYNGKSETQEELQRLLEEGNPQTKEDIKNAINTVENNAKKTIEEKIQKVNQIANKSFIILKNFQSPIDFIEKIKNFAPNAHNHEDVKYLDSAIGPENRKEEIDAQEYFSYYGVSIFKQDGINFGLEICLDHGYNRLKKSGNKVDIQLVPCAGMSLRNDALSLLPNGFAFLCDGNDHGGVQLYSQKKGYLLDTKGKGNNGKIVKSCVAKEVDIDIFRPLNFSNLNVSTMYADGAGKVWICKSMSLEPPSESSLKDTIKKIFCLSKGLTLAMSDEPILLNGMKVLFDNPTPTTPVTLQPKQRGTNNGR